MQNKSIMLTTVDNPYDPFTHFKEWLLYDTMAGYFTSQRLASITYISDSMTSEEVYENVENAMNEIIKFGIINKEGNLIEYKKVIKEH